MRWQILHRFSVFFAAASSLGQRRFQLAEICVGVAAETLTQGAGVAASRPVAHIGSNPLTGWEH